MSNPGNEIGGQAFHVGDCYIWSSIYYLDSPTNYREYLPHHNVCLPTVSGDLVMLDSSKSLTSRSLLVSLVILVLILIIGALLWHLAG
jgi:hypothetical protein